MRDLLPRFDSYRLADSGYGILLGRDPDRALIAASVVLHGRLFSVNWGRLRYRLSSR